MGLGSVFYGFFQSEAKFLALVWAKSPTLAAF